MYRLFQRIQSFNWLKESFSCLKQSTSWSLISFSWHRTMSAVQAQHQLTQDHFSCWNNLSAGTGPCQLFSRFIRWHRITSAVHNSSIHRHKKDYVSCHGKSSADRGRRRIQFYPTTKTGTRNPSHPSELSYCLGELFAEKDDQEINSSWNNISVI